MPRLKKGRTRKKISRFRIGCLGRKPFAQDRRISCGIFFASSQNRGGTGNFFP